MLAIKFGKQREGSKKDADGKKRDEKCRQIDRYALKVFIVVYSATGQDVVILKEERGSRG